MFDLHFILVIVALIIAIVVMSARVRIRPRCWAGYSTNAQGNAIKRIGRKALVADWCLAQAVDGPV